MKFRGKFYVGIVLVILNFLVGNFAKIQFLLHWNEPTYRNWMIVLYVVTWPMFVLGLYWVGTEYADAVRRYTSYKFYQEHAKRGVQKAVDVSREGARKAVEASKAGVDRAVKVGTEKIQKAVRSRTKKTEKKKE